MATTARVEQLQREQGKHLAPLATSVSKARKPIALRFVCVLHDEAHVCVPFSGLVF